MRSINMFLVFLFAILTAGCATVRHVNPETGLEVTYSGTAHGAATVVHAADSRPFNLADKALDKGVPVSLVRDAEGDVRFSAGQSYSYGSGQQTGYAPGTVTYVPGVGLVSTGAPASGLPTLATPSNTPITSGVPGAQSSSVAIVPCPMNRSVLTVAEQSACNDQHINALMRSAR